MAVTNRATLEIAISETSTADAGLPSLPHLFKLQGFDLPDFQVYADGSGANEQNLVHSGTLNLAGAPQSLDLNGGISSKLTGAVQTWATVKGIAVANLSSDTGEAVIIGGGADAVIAVQAAVGPGGVYLYVDPIDGATVTATIADTLQFDPGASTLDVAYIIWGTS